MDWGEKKMTIHPSSRELYDALLRRDAAAHVYDHVEECLACRVRLARLEQVSAPEPPSSNTVQKILDASSVVPGALSLATQPEEREPQPGELWRIGRHEALLAWVRKNFGDGAIDVVPVVLDADLADEQTILISRAKSPLPADLGVMIALRTHVHRGAFISHVADLDISAEVEDVIAATRDGHASAVAVGPQIEHDDDDRLEYRQALRDLLAELSPSAWTAANPVDPDPPPTRTTAGTSTLPDDAGVQAAITDRLWTAKCIPLEHDRFPFGSGQELEALFKVVYLDTAVVVTGVASLDSGVREMEQLVDACRRAATASPDADAVCVAEPLKNWPCLLFSRASMREALELPAGVPAGPVPILDGLGLVDTLWKHLEGADPAWEVVERPPRGIGSSDIAAIASRHAQESITVIEAKGRRAHQAPKKSSWSELPKGLSESVRRFVAAVAQSTPAEKAFAELSQENRRD
jgi:hypothetical protein